MEFKTDEGHVRTSVPGTQQCTTEVCQSNFVCVCLTAEGTGVRDLEQGREGLP